MEYTHIPDISCYYTSKNNAIQLLPHAHFEYQMILVTDGNASFFINHQEYNVEGQSLIFISRLEQHSFMINTVPYERYIISLSSEHIMSNIKDEALLSIFLQRPKDFHHIIHLDDHVYNVILPLFQELAVEYQKQAPFYITRCTTLVIAILIELYRANPHFFPLHSYNNMTDIVIAVQRYVTENFSHPITLQEIAKKHFITRHNLSIAFKNIVGLTFKDYLLQFRISEAKKLLLTTNYSVSQIAEKVGYKNVNNFVQIFKSRESITPLQYRKKTHYLK